MKNIFLAVLFVLVALIVKAEIFVVVTTADNGPGSLREAILLANQSPGADVILFNIPPQEQALGSVNAFVICPQSNLPEITEPVTLNGSSQTEYTGDTNQDGPEIIICFNHQEIQLQKHPLANIRFIKIVGDDQS